MAHKRTAKNRNRISDIEVAKAVIAHEATRCYVAVSGPRGKQPKKLTSCFGGSFWGRQGDSWPLTSDGAPLLPWLQVKCADVPKAYGAFYTQQVITFFLATRFDGFEAVSQKGRADFVVRTFKPNEVLAPMAQPKQLSGHTYFPIRWQEKDDFPSLSKYSGLFGDDVYTTLCDLKQFEFENNSGTKIGGWPTPIQTRQEYPGSCDLQIDVTPNFMYADNGIAYLSKYGEEWHVRFETC